MSSILNHPRFVWALLFFGLLLSLTAILASQVIWVYYPELQDKGFSFRYYLQLCSGFMLIMLPIPCLISIAFAQLVSSIMNPERHLLAALKSHWIVSLSGATALFVLMAFVIPKQNRSSYSLLYDMRMKDAKDATWERTDASLFDDIKQTMTLPRLVQVTEQRKDSVRGNFVRQLIGYYDLESANKLLNREKIDFFKLTDAEIAEIRSLSSKNIKPERVDDIVLYKEHNFRIFRENDGRYRSTIKQMLYTPFLFLVISLSIPLFVAGLRRLGKQ